MSPLQRERGPLFEQTGILFAQCSCFVPSVVDIHLASAVLEKRTKMWKAYNDDGQILIRKAHISLWLRWANEKLSLCAFRRRPLLIKSHIVFTFGAFQTYHTAPMESVLHININFALWSRLLNKGPTTKLHMKVIYVMQKIISSKHSAR